MACSSLPRSSQPCDGEHAVVAARRAVEGDPVAAELDLLRDARRRRRPSARSRRPRPRSWRAGGRPGARPASICGSATSSRYLRVAKPCSRTPSHTRPASLSMSGPTAAIDTGIARQPGRRRRELGRHQREAVVLALVAQRLLLLPAAPDRAQRLDVLAQARHRRAPGHAEAPLVVPLHLRAEPEPEAPARLRVQIPGRLGHHHRAARERDADPRRELDALRRDRRERERHERIVRDLGRHHAVEARRLGRLRRGARRRASRSGGWWYRRASRASGVVGSAEYTTPLESIESRSRIVR